MDGKSLIELEPITLYSKLLLLLLLQLDLPDFKDRVSICKTIS